MVVWREDTILEENDPPTEQTIEADLQRQLQALAVVRRDLIEDYISVR